MNRLGDERTVFVHPALADRACSIKETSMKFIAAALVCSFALLVPHSAQAKRLMGEDGTERVFAKIHSVDQSEIQQAQLALQRSQNQDVKDFAQTMVDDHTAAEQQLAPLAQQLQVPLHSFLPKTRSEIRDDQRTQAALRKLQTVDADDFDETYMEAQVRAHRHALSWVKRNRHAADDAAQDFLKMQVKTISHHLKMARDLEDQIDSLD
jgi:putative membrane protein